MSALTSDYFAQDIFGRRVDGPAIIQESGTALLKQVAEEWTQTR